MYLKSFPFGSKELWEDLLKICQISVFSISLYFLSPPPKKKTFFFLGVFEVGVFPPTLPPMDFHTYTSAGSPVPMLRLELWKILEFLYLTVRIPSGHSKLAYWIQKKFSRPVLNLEDFWIIGKGFESHRITLIYFDHLHLTLEDDEKLVSTGQLPKLVFQR